MAKDQLRVQELMGTGRDFLDQAQGFLQLSIEFVGFAD
jgi:hypothetical protein